MGDRLGNLSRVRMSEDKVRRKDLCGSVRAVYVLKKLPDISGTLQCGRARARVLCGVLRQQCGMVRRTVLVVRTAGAAVCM